MHKRNPNEANPATPPPKTTSTLGSADAMDVANAEREIEMDVDDVYPRSQLLEIQQSTPILPPSLLTPMRDVKKTTEKLKPADRPLDAMSSDELLNNLEQLNMIIPKESVDLRVSTGLLHREHFGWPVMNFVDQVIETVNSTAHEVISNVENNIKDTLRRSYYGSEDEFMSQINPEVQQSLYSLETLFTDAISTVWENFEMYTNRVLFDVPGGLVIPTFIEKRMAALKSKFDNRGDYDRLLDEVNAKIAQRMSMIHARKELNKRLRRNIDLMDQFNAQLDSYIEFLDNLGDAETMSPEYVDIVAEKLKDMQLLNEQPPPSIPDSLKNTNMQGWPNLSSWIMQQAQTGIKNIIQERREKLEKSHRVDGNSDADPILQTFNGTRVFSLFDEIVTKKK